MGWKTRGVEECPNLDCTQQHPPPTMCMQEDRGYMESARCALHVCAWGRVTMCVHCMCVCMGTDNHVCMHCMHCMRCVLGKHASVCTGCTCLLWLHVGTP